MYYARNYTNIDLKMQLNTIATKHINITVYAANNFTTAFEYNISAYMQNLHAKQCIDLSSCALYCVLCIKLHQQCTLRNRIANSH